MSKSVELIDCKSSCICDSLLKYIRNKRLDHKGIYPLQYRRMNMPTISCFYGIIIVMYLRNKEHNPPHIHAITKELEEMWETGKYVKFPPLD